MSKKENYDQMATEILTLVGGKENIATYTNCITRLRITAKDDSLVQVDKLKALDYVLTVQHVAGVYQIVLGPGTVDLVREQFDKLVGNGDDKIDENIDEEKFKKTIAQKFAEMMQAIILPAIGALLAAALILAILNIVKLLGFSIEGNVYLTALQQLGSVTLKGLGVLFAINTAKYFKGNIYLAAAFAMLMVSEVSVTNIVLFGTPLKQGVGGIIGIILMAITLSYIERFITKYVPKALKLLVVPFTTALLTMIVLLLVIIPVSDFLTQGLVNLFEFLYEGSTISRLIGSALIAGLWPALVLSGLHQAILGVLLTVYVETGFTPFVAAAWLGGAAQVGTAGAIYILKRKENPQLSEVFLAGAPAAFVGVIEPLMYGINLPFVKPFFIAMITAACGGLVIGFSGIIQQYGLSGLVGVLSFDNFNSSLIYGATWIGTALLGFIVCYLVYKTQRKGTK